LLNDAKECHIAFSSSSSSSFPCIYESSNSRERERERDFGEEGYEKSKENTKTDIANGFLLFFVSLPVRTNNLAFYY